MGSLEAPQRRNSHSSGNRNGWLGQFLIVGWGVVGAALLAVGEQPIKTTAVADENPINGRRAFGYLRQLCNLGPRYSGSEGMAQQQALLVAHFKELGGQVVPQSFAVRHPLTGARVTMTNLVVHWHPERNRRILLCAHYDTRPLPDRDPNPVRRRNGIFIGANDGASGTALLMELAHLMPQLEGQYGVDFVLFDGEELVYEERRDRYFLGSTWFAQQHANNPPDYQYRWGVLLDMVGDADLKIYQERHSVRWNDTKPLVDALWATAKELGIREFVAQPRHLVRDDHVPLHNIAKISTCNIIDFDYPYWHTEADTPRQCSPTSLAKVGWVVYHWLRNLE